LFCEHPDGSLAIDKHTVLLAGGSIHDCVDALDAENRAAQSRSGVAYDFPAFNKKFWIPFTEKVLSLLLWLCSEEPEIGASAPPTHPKPVKTKQGMRFFSADNVAVWNVGARIGAALLAAKTVSAAATAGSEAGTHARPRGHIRRAHWHTYLTGPKDNPTRVLRWISPVFVNLAPDNLMPSVIHEVA
jgi:hypothetical protein